MHTHTPSIHVGLAVHAAPVPALEPFPGPEPARVRAVTPFTLSDWAGKACAVVYLGGCNLRCPTCHNATLAFTPELHPVLETGSVLASLKARKPWLDGVVVCGGEPTLEPGLADLVETFFALGFAVKVDTNGMRPEAVAAVLARCPNTVFAVDVKGPWDKYPALTGGGVSSQAARERLETVFGMASKHPKSFLFRITLVPGLEPQDVQAARDSLPAGFVLKEQPYLPPPTR
ncbi:MAG: radical SAM protein [Acidobacteriota bacterium]